MSVHKSNMSEENEQSEKILGVPKEDDGASHDELEAILKDLPKEGNMIKGHYLYNYQGFWVPEHHLKGVVSVQKNFVARDDDIILTSCPKTGTTWLKALIFLVARRNDRDDGSSPQAYSHLLKENPHDLVPFLENTTAELVHSQPPTPRLFHTHTPYKSLSPSIRTSDCKIVYISRNPMDQFISMWYFLASCVDEKGEPADLEKCFDMHCRGVHGYGPFWDHVLGFWKASQERPQKILFLKYEDLKKDPRRNVKRLAEFLGFPFSEAEEKNGVIENILGFCSIEKLKNLEVNRKGKREIGIPNSSFFRKGEIGDSKNFLTPAMIERMVNLMKEKYGEHYSSLESSF